MNDKEYKKFKLQIEADELDQSELSTDDWCECAIKWLEEIF